ncbi:MAG: LarC family nickel insertion protein [Synergistaceae bacterium]|jgi:uncharacterized protein (DUF111 family)|nr:LarC family nickel insertion protein [Synergistaceae bacterium]
MRSLIHHKEGCLFLVQTDHLSGEDIGVAIGILYESGARNVQVIPTITKKNRPAYIFLIDASQAETENLEEAIVRELSVTGWHRLNSDHCYIPAKEMKRTFCVSTPGSSFSFVARAKWDEGAAQWRPEQEDCLSLRLLLKAGLVSLPGVIEIKRKLSAAFSSEEKEPSIEFGSRSA